jgi:hypothetical protein
MKWTKEKPTKPGWYWKRRQYFTPEISVDYVRDYAGKLCIMNWEIPDDCEWAGPLKVPED